MIIKYKSNLVSGITSIILALLLFIIIPLQIGEELIQETSQISAKTIPYGIAVLFLVCGICLVIQSLVLKKDYYKEFVLKEELRVALYMAVLAIYGMTFKMSFLITTSILAVVTLIFSQCKNKWYYLISVVAVYILYVIFKFGLNVRLP